MRRALFSILIAALVVATGATGLIYQVAFERYLARLLGSDPLATALTLGVFLGGLALGYRLCGRLTLGVRDHLVAYAALEGWIGVWALFFPWWFARLADYSSSWSLDRPWSLLLAGSFLACALILPPTIAMGATVPFLTRALSMGRARVPAVHAALYSVNTAGAFVGALLAGFLLLPVHGLRATMIGAGIVNLAAAAAFLGVAWSRRRHPASQQLGGIPSRTSTAGPRLPIACIYGIAFLNGFAVLALESAMVRIGRLIFGGSSYTFSMVVAVFVLAIAAGSLAVSRATAIPRRLLFGCQVACGAYLLALYLTFDHWPYYAHLVRIGFQSGAVGFHLYHAALLVALSGALFVPVALLGATLPILFHELGADVPESGWVSGRLLSWNGVGCVAGCLLAGFLLFYVLDLARVFLVVPLVVGLAATLTAWSLSRRDRAVAVATVLIALAFVALRPYHDPARWALGTYRTREPLPFSLAGPGVFFEQLYSGRRIVALTDDPVATVGVLAEEPTEGDSSEHSLSLLINGKSESNTLGDTDTLRLLAHVPGLWAHDRERVLVIGLGTGVTVGQLALYPDVARIDAVEISPSVVRFLPRFGAFNHDVQNDPRVHIHVADALRFLRSGSRSFGVIVSQPSNPWVSGADQLFTRECYRLIRSRLDDDGVFVQWIHTYESNFEVLALVLNTLRAEFPVVHAFRGTKGDLVLLAAVKPFTDEDLRRADATFERTPGVRASLAEIGITATGQILTREVRTLPVLLTQGAHHGINTMDRPRLHYLAGRAMFSGESVTDEMLSGVIEPDFLWRR